MRRLRRWRRMFLARLAVELGVLLLIATAVNVPMGMATLKGRLGRVRSFPVMLRGSQASVEGWPWRTPPTQAAWPAPTSVDRYDRWNYSSLMAQCSDGANTTFQMEVESAGWPLRVVALAMYWYPPSYRVAGRESESEPPPQILWAGVVLNPVIVSAGAWLLLVAPVESFFAVRWRRRIGRRLCPYCAYPSGRADVCTECGRAAVAPLRE